MRPTPGGNGSGVGRLRFDRPDWLDILGGSKVMIESPFIQEIVAESERTGRVKTLLDILKDRFGSATPTITAGLEQVKEPKRLRRLTTQAFSCKSLEAFEKALLDELPRPRPASTRGKRRSRNAAE
jgi:hypothetical protein